MFINFFFISLVLCWSFKESVTDTYASALAVISAADFGNKMLCNTKKLCKHQMAALITHKLMNVPDKKVNDGI